MLKKTSPLLTASSVLALPLLLSSCSLFASDSASELSAIIESPTVEEFALLESAMESYDRGLLALSRESWSELKNGYPGSQYLQLAELKIADAFYYAHDYSEAVTAYEEFRRNHPHNEAGQYALFQIGNSHKQQYKGPDHDQSPLHAAIREYTALTSVASNSKFASMAQEKIQKCRKLLAEHEARVASFYKKQGLVKASLNRYNTLLNDYPDTPPAQEIPNEMRGQLSKGSTTTDIPD